VFAVATIYIHTLCIFYDKSSYLSQEARNRGSRECHMDVIGITDACIHYFHLLLNLFLQSEIGMISF